MTSKGGGYISLNLKRGRGYLQKFRKKYKKLESWFEVFIFNPH